MVTDQGDESSSTPIRVLVAHLPGAMVERIKPMIGHQQDMLLVGEVDDHLELLLAAGDNVHVVVLGASRVRPPPGICSHLLSEYPDVKILVLETGGTAAAFYWMGVCQQSTRMKTPEALVTLIRRAYSGDSTI